MMEHWSALDVREQNWNEQERLNEAGLRHEDCSCEECLLRLEEEYDKMAEDYKRLDQPNKYPWNEYEDLGEGC